MRATMHVCLITGFLGVGCAESDSPPPGTPAAGCDAGLLEVEIGTGDSTHGALTDGDAVTFALHPQGLFYLPVSVRTVHADTVVELHASITDPETGLTLSETAERVQLIDRGDCVGEYWGLKSFLSASTSAGLAPGEDGHGGTTEVEVNLTVENLDGSFETSSVRVTARLTDTGEDGPKSADVPPGPIDRG